MHKKEKEKKEKTPSNPKLDLLYTKNLKMNFLKNLAIE
jgi:hypothetical protein